MRLLRSGHDGMDNGDEDSGHRTSIDFCGCWTESGCYWCSGRSTHVLSKFVRSATDEHTDNLCRHHAYPMPSHRMDASRLIMRVNALAWMRLNQASRHVSKEAVIKQIKIVCVPTENQDNILTISQECARYTSKTYVTVRAAMHHPALARRPILHRLQLQWPMYSLRKGR